MSEPGVPPEIFAFALVFEGSCTTQERASFLNEFMQPIGKRFVEVRGKTNPQFKAAVVTYGVSDSLPTPLLGRRFFIDWKNFLELVRPGGPKVDSYFALRDMNPPGPSGMSALEGLVAAIELFQELELTTNAKVSKYIIHLAHSPPDDAINPLWNKMPELDDVTWETLPEEFTKRNINYNLISSTNKPEALARLYTNASAGKTVAPWFNVPDHLSASLAGIPTAPNPAPATASTPQPQPQPKTTVPKRPSEAEQRQDPKRQRISDSPSQPASRPATTKTTHPPAPVSTPPASVPPPTAVPTPLPASTPAQVPSVPASASASAPAPAPPPPLVQEMFRKGQSLQLSINALQSEGQAAKNMGDSNKLQQIQQQLVQKAKEMAQLKSDLSEIMRRQQVAQGTGGPGPSQQQVARGPQNPPGHHNQGQSLAGGGFKPNTPENRPTTGPPSGPQFGSPSMSSAASMTMNQASSSMNPMVSAQIMAQAQQAQQAQARAAQGQGASGPGGQSAGAAGSSTPFGMTLPAAPPQQPINATEIDRQDWNRKLNQQGDASNRPIPGPAPPPPFPIPAGLMKALGSVPLPDAINPVEITRKYMELQPLANAQHGKLQIAVKLQQMVKELNSELTNKSIKERGSNPNFPDSNQGLKAIWKGTLRWAANFGSGKKEVSMKVKAMHHDPEVCRANTWAQSMLLVPAPRPAEMLTVFTAWLNKYQPAVCLMELDSDTPEEEHEYKRLYMQLELALVRPEGYFAYAQWHNPGNHEQTPNAVFFTIGPKLVGAFLPLYGFPELPHEVKPTAGMVWDYVKTHWRPELLQLFNAFGAEVKPEMRQDAVEALAVKIRERIREGQNIQLRLIQLINGGPSNPDALNVFVLQHVEFPNAADFQSAMRYFQEAQQQQQQRVTQAQQQAAQQQRQRQMAMMQMMGQNNGANGGMGGMGGMNLSNLGNFGGMNMGGGMTNMANLGGMIGVGAGMPNMGNLGNLGGMGGGGNMGMGAGMPNMNSHGGMGGGIPNLGAMGGLNMNLGNLGGMGGHGAQQQ